MRLDFAIVVAIGIVISACSNSETTGPATPTSVATTASPAVSGRLTGLVTDDTGSPVPMANVVTYSQGGTRTASTDEQGFYEIDSTNGPMEVSAAKDGFERSLRFLTAVPKQDIRLHRMVRLAAGASRIVTVAPDDSMCGLEDEYTCRTIRVVAPGAGLLHVSVTTASAPLFWGLAIARVDYPC
jgi:Carboxypeptidase regulatory-like domain